MVSFISIALDELDLMLLFLNKTNLTKETIFTVKTPFQYKDNV